MNFIRNVKSKIVNSRLIAKLKTVKNVELVIAVILALIAAVAYFALSTESASKETASVASSVEMNETEARLAEVISEISGVGRSRVLITTGTDDKVVGVVVIAEGAESMENRVKMIRCAMIATGATVDEIEIFEMQKGG
ncbi:MAG: hypothetical protein J5765_01730 [Clostridia bacterium]|nr:hypothetical protein [Clostridia bacterium]